MKSEEAKKGTKVTWNSPQGRVEGEVVKKVKQEQTVKVGEDQKRKVKASASDPKVVVKSDQSEKQAVHTPKALKKKS